VWNCLVVLPFQVSRLMYPTEWRGLNGRWRGRAWNKNFVKNRFLRSRGSKNNCQKSKARSCELHQTRHKTEANSFAWAIKFYISLNSFNSWSLWCIFAGWQRWPMGFVHILLPQLIEPPRLSPLSLLPTPTNLQAQTDSQRRRKPPIPFIPLPTLART